MQGRKRAGGFSSPRGKPRARTGLFGHCWLWHTATKWLTQNLTYLYWLPHPLSGLVLSTKVVQKNILRILFWKEFIFVTLMENIVGYQINNTNTLEKNFCSELSKCIQYFLLSLQIKTFSCHWHSYMPINMNPPYKVVKNKSEQIGTSSIKENKMVCYSMLKQIIAQGFPV